MNFKRLYMVSAIALASANAYAHDPAEAGNISTAPTAAITEAVQTGTGEHSYTTVPGWGKVPGSDYIGSTHGGIVIDKAGNVYVSTNGPQTLCVFTPAGEFIRSFGKEFGNIHGMNINSEADGEFIYAAAMGKVMKISLDGKIVMTIDGKAQKWGKGTAVAVAATGDIFIADGYGSSIIFKYNSKGEFIKQFGVKGDKDGEFKTSHGLGIDNRNPEKPMLIVCDRENRRIQLLDLDGNLVKVATTGLRRPCSLSQWGEFTAVAELEGRVAILDKDYKLVSVIGDNPNKKEWANFPVPPKDWQAGIFTAPHGVSYDANGNLYVMDWNQSGRVTKLTRDKK
jgi:hypothetical protein